MTLSLTGDPRTDAVVPVASRLAWAVRLGDRDGVDEAINEVTTLNGPGLHTLAVVLAAMVPVDQSPGGLLAWLRSSRLRAVGVNAPTAAVLAPETASDEPDEAAVLRCMAGHLPGGELTVGERREVVRRLHGHGLSDREIARWAQISARTVLRIRGRLGLAANTRRVVA
ncbi:hypothetical protein [Sciscionella sediminilitoris]|uniref:hypothetical protein n=1 Tax=Sciscionella sediminilitoris TaxID=1445613 RepID=UPI0004DF09D5|nr:hypothetical protein [Sciscionella sp. SE31]